LKLWDNNIKETATPKDFVKELFVHKSGLHHVDVFEDTIDAIKHVLVAAVSFTGEITFFYINAQNEPSKLDNVSVNEGTDSFWAVKFLKDSRGQVNRFAASSPTGFVKIWNFIISEEGIPTFTLHHIIEPQLKSFAISIDLNSEANLLATGYQNGDVVLTNIENGKPVYTFHSFGLKNTSANSSSVRSVKFSPLGKIIAVASDFGSNGTITLYDTQYGENVGNFTLPSHSSQAVVGAYAHDGWVFEVDFSETGESLASAGYDGKVRVWKVATRERESTIALSPTDVDDADIVTDADNNVSSAFGVKFVNKGIRSGSGGDTNEGLVVISKDRGIRWYREAGGI
jgi:superkiller protein 8